MNLETAFLIANALVFPAWVLLAVQPRGGVTDRLVHSSLYPIFYGVLYTGLMIYAFGSTGLSAGASFLSLAGLQAMFSSPLAVLIAWVHYLVFDLFVGAWIARDSVRRGVADWLRLVALFFTLMTGPIGLWLYLTLRWATGKASTLLLEVPGSQMVK